MFGAYALGALSREEAEAIRDAVAGWPEGETELAELMEMAAALPLVPDATARPSMALEGRIIAEARRRPSGEQAVARARRTMSWWRRHLPHTLAASFAVIAVAIGALWLTEADPNPAGRWLALETRVSEEPGGWVYVTDYKQAPVSLLFWQAEPAPAGTSYQLFRILADGTTSPDRVFTIRDDGSGMIRIERQPEVELQGFAVVLIEGEEALRGRRRRNRWSSPSPRGSR